jgi:PAS domain S-box-containing protein
VAHGVSEGLAFALRQGAAIAGRMTVSAAGALIGVVLAACYLVGLTEPLDRFLLEQRLAALSRPASGSLVVVEIDARSLRALDRWPWPRSVHADAIDRLREAGAALIALDIDFSARSEPADDAALAAAIARAGDRLVLPNFVQGASAREHEILIESAPHSVLIGPHTQIGGVNVVAENDGRLWRYVVGLETDGAYRPSLAVVMAGGGIYSGQSFYIDYSIREDTLPVISMADVLAGSFDPAMVAGRKVIVGATAAELGDTQAVPVYGTLPGVFVQALAYETLLQGRAIARVNPALTVLGLAVLLPLLSVAARPRRARWQRGLAATGGIALSALVAGVVLQETMAVSLDMAIWLLALGAWSSAGLVRALQSQAGRLLRRHVQSLRRRRLMRAIVETSFDGIVVVDSRDRVSHANPTAARILKRAAPTVAGIAATEFLPAPALEQIRAARAGAAGVQEHRLGDGGDAVDIELAARALDSVADGTAGAVVLTFRDVTERNRADRALRAALVEAESASRLKSEFLAAISHELRTPLNAILGFSEIIRDRHLGPVPDRYAGYAGEIHTSGQRLLGLVESILDFAAAASGRLQLKLEPVSVAPVLRAVVVLHGAAIEERRHRVVIVDDGAPAPLVVADARRLEEVASHLLSNAIKFTPPGGRLELRALSGGAQGGFEIRDSGIGMTEDQIRTALQPFTQVDGRLERVQEGAGIGLPLARKLVDLQGGTLEVSSVPGVGTRVCVRLPLAAIGRAAA